MSASHSPKKDYAFIETTEGESAVDWQRAVEDILNGLWDDARKYWWTPFVAGPVVHWSGRAFRAFRCPAGSVVCWLMVEGQKRALSRAVLILAERGAKDPEWPVIAMTIEHGRCRDDDAAPVVAELKRLQSEDYSK